MRVNIVDNFVYSAIIGKHSLANLAHLQELKF